MTLGSFLLMLVLLFCVGALAYWVITKFLQPPAQGIALTIVGVLLLIILLTQALPDTMGLRLWK